LWKERDHSLSKRKSAFKIGDVSKKQIHKLERKHHKDKMRELRKST
jgi:hypothetical protein